MVANDGVTGRPGGVPAPEAVAACVLSCGVAARLAGRAAVLKATAPAVGVAGENVIDRTQDAAGGGVDDDAVV
ncbi:hypothetical protein [Streptomyces coeruleorubidus]|uniref:hypothetical protein n=1 Tax=Streptomyces coeruleorubidus TaxID=116188 RepID=UPI00339DB9E7